MAEGSPVSLAKTVEENYIHFSPVTGKPLDLQEQPSHHTSTSNENRHKLLFFEGHTHAGSVGAMVLSLKRSLQSNLGFNFDVE